MAELGEANIGGRMVPAWLLDTPAKYLDGDLQVIQANDDLDSYITPGEYIQGSTSVILTLVNFPVNLPKGEMCLKVSSLGGPGYIGYICQEIKAKNSLRFGRAIRFSNNGVFQPWEYEDPELMLGVEYRTTERYLGKPVYVKLVDLGEGTNGKTVNVGTTEMIHVECRATYSSWSLPMPELPFGSTDRSLENTSAQAFYSNANTVTIIMGSTCPAFTATAKVYYIKSTD